MTVQQDQVERLCRYIDAHVEEQLTLETLGALVGWSPAHVQKMFKKWVGVSPKHYHDAKRMEALKTHLKAKSNVTEAIFEAGYGSLSRVYEHSDQTLGMTPGDYQRGAQDISVTYTVAQTWIGTLLLAATDRGLCAVSIGDDESSLLDDLHHEFSQATIVRTSALPGSALDQWLNALNAHLQGVALPTTLPLDIQGTAFQRLVWNYLRTIPSGQTRTYKEVATALDKPTASRAVARACATNALALVIPCHRVIRSDGGMAGYRWGLSRKERLLEHENSSTLATGVEMDNTDQG